MRRVLNDRIIKALKPAKPGQRYDVMDAVLPGLGVRVTDKGTRSFVLVARFPGSNNPTRRALGEYGALGLAEAREEARKWLGLIGRGLDPAAEGERQRLAEQRKHAGTFASVAEVFIKEKLSTERRGHDAELQVRNEFISRWGKRPITEIDAADVKAVIREVKARGAFYMAHQLLATCRRMFAWAIEQGDYGLEHSPCAHLKARSLIGEKRPRTRILTDAELRAFWRACDKLRYPHGDIGKLLLLTGGRHREVAAAPWSEFDLAKATWTIDPKRFKSNSEHIVPLTADMLALIRDLPLKSSPFLFVTPGNKVATDITEKVKTKIDTRMLRTLRALARHRGEDASATELKPWVVHDLRRTVRTQLAALRVPDAIAEMILGHGKKGLQRVYDQHTYADEMRDALERWNARLRSILEPPPANVVAIRGRKAKA